MLLHEDFREVRSCRLCGSASARTLYRFEAGYYPHDQYETSSWDGRALVPSAIVECTECGYRYSSPSFRESELHRVYPPELAAGSSPALAWPRFDLADKKANSLLKIAARHAPQGGRLVDVGARFGVLPFVAEHRFGFRAHGLEYNAAAVTAGRTRFPHLTAGGLEALDDVLTARGWGAVDVFVLDDVVEHLVEPVRDLKRLAAHQEEGGVIVLRQMDADGLGARMFGRHWYYYQPAAHISYFTEASLSRLLEMCGYRPVEIVRPPVLTNVAKTLALVGPSRLRTRWRRLQSRIRGTRPIYNEHRLRMNDDMFTLVARRGRQVDDNP